MSDPGAPDPHDYADLTAAEYVVGVLPGAERRAAERRMELDPAFARAVDHWSDVLAPFADRIESVEPGPQVWQALADRLDSGPATDRPAAASLAEGAEARLRRALALWRGLAASASAIAAVLLAAFVWPRPATAPAAPLLTARLAPTTGASTFVVSLDQARHELIVTPVSSGAPAGRSPELWLIPAGGKPIALGVLTFSRTVRLEAVSSVGAAGRTTLAVSIEPQGGSPTGQPTGPVVAQGGLQAL